MKYGHKINTQIHGYDEKGRGYGQIEILPREMRKVVTPFTAQGDEVVAVFAKREYGLKICKLDEIVKPSPDRIETTCPHAATCGGCLWQHIRYEAQLIEKERGVRELFDDLGLKEAVRPIIPAKKILGYRNRMDFCVGWNGEVGLKEYGTWNKYVDVQECQLLKSGVKDILQTVRELMKQFDLQPWDAKFHKGDVRYIVIRDGQNTNQRMVTIVVSDASRISKEARVWLVERLTTHPNPLITSLLLGELTKPTDLSLAESFEVLVGNPWLEESVNGITYRIHPNSFFQTNSQMAAVLQDEVISKIEGSKTLLDLYCGLGFFGIAAAKKQKIEVFGYELDEEAIKLAAENSAQNGVEDKCRFESGKAEDLSWKEIKADTVIVDPPRSGLHPRVIKALSEMRPNKLIYVSCNYHRLKDELPAFVQNYQVESIQPIDLFPQTPHVEVVVTLRSLLRQEGVGGS
ncbi:MAG: 23S rRNA (uracil(1939)-C(5))-methyltransferase RlmD [Candidatus Portnoybacteria bacterium]|nr:23S rRNA (uracil(1939)-C(5))-methyltransferase RlmD [Candidatus Portnoybacteria bacterium]